jgi:hypothetical protein
METATFAGQLAQDLLVYRKDGLSFSVLKKIKKILTKVIFMWFKSTSSL